jgi:hypothetical protein
LAAAAREAAIPFDTGKAKSIAKGTEVQWSNALEYQKKKLLKQKLPDR